MFYLKHFLKFILKNGTCSLFFIMSISLFITISHNSGSIANSINSGVSTFTGPYFNVLMQGNLGQQRSIIRKVKQLPGVENIKYKSAKVLKKQITASNSILSKDLLNATSNSGMASLTIFLNSKIRAEKVNLIKEYIDRLSGKLNVKFSNVKTIDVKTKQENQKSSVTRYLAQYIVILSYLFLIVSSFFIARNLKNYGFLISKFQRKSNAALKIFLSAFSTTVLTVFIININVNPQMIQLIPTLGLVAVLGMISWYLYKEEFYLK